MSQLLKGKKGLILGVANKRSLAWSIAQAASSEGAEIAFTYQGERLKEKVETLTQELPGSLTMACDATSATEIEAVMKQIEQAWGKLDFVVHAIAFAKAEELSGEYLNVTEEGFLLAMNVSAYTLSSVTKAARPLLRKSDNGGSVVTLTYLGGERVMPGYNVMGVAKSALDMSVRYLANDLGKENIRVNAISAGPVNTLAARGIRGFSEILKIVRERAPLQRNIEAAEVGKSALFLLSDMSSGVTGEILHVDAGFHITA
ncbi:MAG: enoyl-[acyl-carrier protein] reductase I [Candidatus Omnitrophota bacterium]|jgi:enoyl-[acyl-carrier protein] reductase I